MEKAKKQRAGVVDKKPAFLAAYVGAASITKAAEITGMDRSIHYQWLAEDPAYVKAFAAARIEAASLLEDEAVRRAYEGITEPVIYQGELCYPRAYDPKAKRTKISKTPLAIRKYSDSLLQFLLRGLSPAYRERSSLEVTGADGGPLEITDKRLEKLTDKELADLIAVAQKLES